MEFDKEIDTSGLNCPLPILKAKKALNDLTSGQVLKVIATDPGSWRDFEAFAKQTGNASRRDREALLVELVRQLRRNLNSAHAEIINSVVAKIFGVQTVTVVVKVGDFYQFSPQVNRSASKNPAS